MTVKGTKKQAEAKLAELEHQLNTGVPVGTSRITVRDYLASWLTDVVALRNRPRTVESYALIVRKHLIPALGSIQIAKLQPADVQRMEAQLLASGMSGSTVLHVHICLGKALKDAARMDLVHRIVTQAVEPPSPGRYEVTVPDNQAIQEILNLAWDTHYGSILHFASYTGVRRGEAIALRWANVDLDRAFVSIVETAQRLRGQGIIIQPTKSAAGRRGISLDAGTVEMLRAHRGKQLLLEVKLGGNIDPMGLVFPAPIGGPIEPAALTREFHKLAIKAGCPGVRLHDLRHGHAAGLMIAGVYPKTVQERLGHANAAFTMNVYGHVSAGMQAQAADAFAKYMEQSG